jgi:hypothetical protein
MDLSPAGLRRAVVRQDPHGVVRHQGAGHVLGHVEHRAQPGRLHGAHPGGQRRALARLAGAPPSNTRERGGFNTRERGCSNTRERGCSNTRERGCSNTRERLLQHQRERLLQHPRERLLQHPRERLLQHHRERLLQHQRERLLQHQRERLLQHQRERLLQPGREGSVDAARTYARTVTRSDAQERRSNLLANSLCGFTTRPCPLKRETRAMFGTRAVGSFLLVPAGALPVPVSGRL